MPGNQHYYFSKDQPITRVISNVKEKKKKIKKLGYYVHWKIQVTYIFWVCLCVRVCVREKIVSEFSLKKNQTDISESTAESASACLLCASHTSSICRWRTSTLLQMLCYSLIMDYRQLLSILTMCGQPLPAFWSLRSAGYIKHKQKSATPMMGSIE